MHKIVCLKFGTKYDAQYVNNLFKGCLRNTTLPVEFYCFTEDPTGLDSRINVLDLPHSLPGVGWWQKLYMFSKDVPIEGRVLYIDLDTVIVGNIDDILRIDNGFYTLHDFYCFRNPNYRDRWGNHFDAVGSGLMSFEMKKHSQIWESFIVDPQAAIESLHPHGDQRWIQQEQKERKYFQDDFPNQVLSYKVHCCLQKAKPANARIVCYHGKPSIPESFSQVNLIHQRQTPPTPWIKDYWG